MSGGVPELVGAGAGVGLPVPGGWDRIQVPDPAATAAAVRRIWADLRPPTAGQRATVRWPRSTSGPGWNGTASCSPC